MSSPGGAPPLSPRLPLSGVVLADQIKSLDWRARRAERICALPARTVGEVLARALTLVSPE